jgi:hypothetical protein
MVRVIKRRKRLLVLIPELAAAYGLLTVSGNNSSAADRMFITG